VPRFSYSKYPRAARSTPFGQQVAHVNLAALIGMGYPVNIWWRRPKTRAGQLWEGQSEAIVKLWEGQGHPFRFRAGRPNEIREGPFTQWQMAISIGSDDRPIFG
jgi:hypothetical protein